MKNDYDVIISVDIGLSGGISFFDLKAGELLAVYNVPTKDFTNKSGRTKSVFDLEKFLFIFEIPKVHNESALVIFEDVHAFGNAGFGIGTLMEQKGVIRGMVKAFNYTEFMVAPKTWQAKFGIVPPKGLKGKTVKKTKEVRRKWLKDESLTRAKELFPEWKDKIKKSDGLSDSLLIGKWALDYLDAYTEE